MNRQIRRLGIALLVLFALLFLQLNNLQLRQHHKLANAPGNVRTVLNSFAVARGDIQSSDGVVVAKSVPSNDLYKYQRQYPTGPLFAHIVGYDSLIYGSDGVEATYDAQLTGHNLPLRNLKDLLGPHTSTGNLTLTISDHLQSLAASQLGSKHGAVVAINPTTGALLAMYSSPSYDPNPLVAHVSSTIRSAWNAYQADPSQPMLARAFRRSYPPGSTFKVVDTAAVLDLAPQLATKSYPVLRSLTLPNTTHTLSNFAHEACGGMLPELLKVSCDTGYGQIGLDLGAQKLYQEAHGFGFDQHPPLDLPSPAASTFPPPSAFARDLPGLAFSAIGQQNVSATALQMAMVAAAIADKGTIMTPHVMAQIRDTQGNVVETYHPHSWLQATSAATAGTVTSMMIGVVQGGTATNMAIPGTQVAAKTGTAQGAGTSNTTWMVAFAPAQNPTVAVAVAVEPQPSFGPNPTGAEIAGPIARAMLVAALAPPAH
ncbi:MAG: peptidoglycan D,D-transpeptidase FtsI family protein [Acidimicrobiales bacterium]